MNYTKPRVFISHSSQDKSFAEELAWELRRFGLNVWYDTWEIAVGDSIIDKIFDGLKASDTLIIILSPNSVTSRWVKEELSVAVMRRISENSIRILPVLIETCDIPTPLRHIRYADFRRNREEALFQLLDSIAPGHMMWESLSHLYDHFCLLCDQLLASNFQTDVSDKILVIHSLLESALNLRTEIEFRRARQRMHDFDFFEKIGLLADKGVDVRSQTWNALVRFRASLAHSMRGREATLHAFARILQERYPADDMRQSLLHGMERLKEIMRMICFESWGYDESVKTKHDYGT